jgi:hypothetical protein
MIVRLAAICMLGALACSPVDKDSTVERNSYDRVLFYSEGACQEIKGADAGNRIVEEAIRLFSQADDMYLKSVSESDLDRYRESMCIEVLFAKSRSIFIKAIKVNKEIAKILVPLTEDMCKRHAHIIYGDADYKPFNLVLNSEGCDKLREVIEGALRE